MYEFVNIIVAMVILLGLGTVFQVFALFIRGGTKEVKRLLKGEPISGCHDRPKDD